MTPTPTTDPPAFYLIRDTASAQDGYRYATLSTHTDARTMSGGVASCDRIPPSRARRMTEARTGDELSTGRGYHLTVTADAAHALGQDCWDSACMTCYEA